MQNRQAGMIALIVVAVVLTVGCGAVGGSQAPTVYAAGSEWLGGVNIAEYWKNGTAVRLTDGTRDAAANAITESASDVYVAGGEGGAAKYWKNGTAVMLADQGSAQSILVSGVDVYVAGCQCPTWGHCIAGYWKNGGFVAFTDGSGNAVANSILISGGDIYVAGYEYKMTNGWFTAVAEYWKNGAPVQLTAGPNLGQAYSIFVAGTDVYVAGSEIDSNLNRYAKYWKNGAPVKLSGDWLGEARSIVVVDQDVYVSGKSRGGAAVWKNGVLMPLGGATANQILVSGADVYVAGEINRHAVYWKNGVAVPLTSCDGACQDWFTGLATSISVVNQ